MMKRILTQYDVTSKLKIQEWKNNGFTPCILVLKDGNFELLQVTGKLPTARVEEVLTIYLLTDKEIGIIKNMAAKITELIHKYEQMIVALKDILPSFIDNEIKKTEYSINYLEQIPNEHTL